MKEIVRFALGLGLRPIGGRLEHAIEQKQRVPIFGQQVGERRPAAQERFVCNLESRGIGATIGVGGGSELDNEKASLG